ncbi:MAG: tetratricopeptide repeat protein [bacterium]|nr:tetratricopeptide repeat protein [bacterium]
MEKRNKLIFSASKSVLFLLMALVFFQPINSADLKPEIAEALDQGDSAKALEMLKSEIELDKGYYFNYYMLGLIYFNQGQYDKAREPLETAVDKKSKHWESVYHLGRTYLYLGELELAEKTLTKGLKKSRDLKHLFENGLGLIEMRRENYSDADRYFRSAIVADDKNAEYHINLGDANFYQGIPSLAISEYKTALELDTAGLEVYYHWAEACLEMKDYGCAIEKLKVVLSKDSTHAPAWNRAGGIYFKAALSTRTRDERKQRFMETIGSYKKYLELSGAKADSSTVRAYFETALSYANIFGFEDAAKYFEMVLSIPYEPRDIHFYYGKSLWGIKKYEEAATQLLRHIEWVAEQDEDYRNNVDEAELYRLLGDSYYYRKPGKDFFSAIKYYKKSLENDPDQKRILQNVAVGYHSTKSYVQAIEYYEKRIALGLDTNSASIYKNAGYCALNIANNGASGEEDIDIMDEEEGEDIGGEADLGGVDPNVDYYQLAVDYMDKFLEYHPTDTKVLLLVADTYFRQMGNCAKGVATYERLLALDANNCDAKKAIGYAYFGGEWCEKNYDKALRYLHDAQKCVSAASGNCGDADLMLWIAQCYHLKAADIVAAKGDANEEFKQAFTWYGKVLKCEPNNEPAKKGQDDTRFEFFDK